MAERDLQRLTNSVDYIDPRFLATSSQLVALHGFRGKVGIPVGAPRWLLRFEI